MPALRAGLAYFALIFALGFVLGTARVLWLAPALGSETQAVLLELPIMLAASWLAARHLVARHRLTTLPARALMGTLAFALLMLAEASLPVLAFGQSPAHWAAGLVAMPGVLGLAGQVGFAVMPVVVGRRSPRR